MKTLRRFAVLTLVAAAVSPALAGEATHLRAEQTASVPRAVEQSAAIRTSHVVTGSFDALAATDRRLVERVFAGQSVTALGAAPLNLDQIAAIKQTAGWSGVFAGLKARGLTRARNVKDLVRGLSRRAAAKARRHRASGGRVTVVTTAQGHRIYFYQPAGGRAEPTAIGQGS